jgi:putative protease|tara:strand:- start:1649 stop:1903 length:255 start_codon:yes stop_codon:yes gene_type:complete
MVKDKQVGTVSNYFDHVKVAAIKLTTPLKKGDRVEIRGGEVDFKQKIVSMQIQREKVEKAKKGDEIGIKVNHKVRKGYKVFKVA